MLRLSGIELPMLMLSRDLFDYAQAPTPLSLLHSRQDGHSTQPLRRRASEASCGGRCGSETLCVQACSQVGTRARKAKRRRVRQRPSRQYPQASSPQRRCLRTSSPPDVSYWRTLPHVPICARVRIRTDISANACRNAITSFVLHDSYDTSGWDGVDFVRTC
jgi:hypothetical protein